MHARASESKADKAPPRSQTSRVFSRLSTPTPSPAHPLLELQRAIGNQAKARLLRARLEGDPKVQSAFHGGTRSFGTPLRIGVPDDTYEQEADHVADQVTRKTEAQPVRPYAAAEEAAHLKQQPAETHLHPQIKSTAAGAESNGAVPSIVHEVLDQPGQPLDASTRAFLEPRFGHDFGKVRVHSDARAAESASAVNARAYTVGRNVVFGAGQFAPGMDAGKRLLAHELTHVLQQHAGSPELQRQPDQKAQGTSDFELPWKHGRTLLFETRSSDIRFLVGVYGESQEHVVRAAIPAIGKQIEADNLLVKDPSSRVMTCFIVHKANNRFALWNGNPAIVLDPFKHGATVEVAAHEMGHAIFYALYRQAESSTEDATKAANFRLGVADIYARLKDTNAYSEGNETHPAGLWFADPSQWAPGAAQKRPRQDRGSQQESPPPRTAEKRAAEKRTDEDPLAEERAAEKREAEERAAEKRAAEKRAAEKRAAEKREAEKRSDEDFLKEFGGVQATQPADVKPTEEHPWDNPDELFASAKAAYQVNPKGLEDAITRFKKIDPRVEAPANEMLALVKEFFDKKHLPPIKVPEERAEAANKALAREVVVGVGKVEQVMPNTLLDWLLNPRHRP